MSAAGPGRELPVEPLPSLPATSLYRLFADRAEARPTLLAFWGREGGEWRGLSMAEARERVHKAAAYLAGLGIGPDDRVAIFAENSADWVIADQAILARGAVVVPIYPTSTAEELRFLLQDSGARVVFAGGSRRVEAAVGLAPELVTQVIAFDQPESGMVAALSTIFTGPRPPVAPDVEGLARTPEALATIVYTSGTTGRPKGVMLTHGNILANLAACQPLFPLSAEDSCLSFLPLSHMLERTAGYYFMVASGVPIYYAESFDRLARNFREVKPTVTITVPRLCEKAYSHVQAAARDGSLARRLAARFAGATAQALAKTGELGRKPGPLLKLARALADRLVFAKIREGYGGRLRMFFCGGAPLTPEVGRFFDGIGIPIMEGYGLTETAPVIAVSRPGETAYGTVGRPLPGFEVRIAEDGEIICRGPQVMRGYLNLPVDTGEVLVDGWFHTGDIGEFDAGGRLRITDRKKSLLVLSSGKKVAPMEVESGIKSEALVYQVVPWGENRPFISALVVPDFTLLARLLEVPAPKTTEERMALVSDRRAVKLVQGRITAAMRGMAPYKRVRRVLLHHTDLTLASGELTPTMKVKVRVIRERYGPLLDALYGEDD